MRKPVALVALLVLVLPAFTCSLWHKPSYKWHLTLEIDPSVLNRGALVQETATILDNRLNRIGIRDYSVQVFGDAEVGRLRVNLAEVADRERLKKYVTSQGLLQLVHILSDQSPAPATTYASQDEALAAIKATSASAKPLPYVDESTGLTADSRPLRWVVAELPPIVEGKDLRSATAVPQPGRDGEYQVHFTLTRIPATKFGIWTAANIGEYLGVALNNEVKSIAYIKSQIIDSGVITGRFTKEVAEDLAQILMSGPLPAPLKIVEEGEN